MCLRAAVAALGCLLAGCSGGSVPEGYEAAMIRPPTDGARPTEGLPKRGHRALLLPSAPAPVGIETADSGASDFRVAASDDTTVREILAEDDRQQDFLFLIAGGEVGQERFTRVIRAVCEHTQLYDREAGKHPTTIIPVQPMGSPSFDPTGAPVSPFRYNVLRTGTLNAMLEQTERFGGQMQRGQSIGFLLVSSRTLRDRLAAVPEDMAPRQIASDTQLRDALDQLQADEDVIYFNVFNVPKHVLTQSVPYIVGIDSKDKRMIDRIVRSLDDHMAREEIAPGALVRGNDDPLREMNTMLDDEALCPMLRSSAL